MTGYKTASSIGWTLVAAGFVGGLVQGIFFGVAAAKDTVKAAEEAYAKAAEEAAKSAEEARNHTGKK